MKPKEIQFSQNLAALSAPQCRRIIESLMVESIAISDLPKTCKLTPASVNKHLEILKNSGLVKTRAVNGIQTAQIQMSKFKPTLDWFEELLS